MSGVYKVNPCRACTYQKPFAHKQRGVGRIYKRIMDPTRRWCRCAPDIGHAISGCLACIRPQVIEEKRLQKIEK